MGQSKSGIKIRRSAKDRGYYERQAYKTLANKSARLARRKRRLKEQSKQPSPCYGKIGNRLRRLKRKAVVAANELTLRTDGEKVPKDKLKELAARATYYANLVAEREN